MTTAGHPCTQISRSQLQGSGTTTNIPRTQQGSTVSKDGQHYKGFSSSIAPAGSTFLLPLPPAIPAPVPSFSAITAAGLIFDIDLKDAIISGTTLQIGPGATPTRIVIGGETMTAGPNGLTFHLQLLRRLERCFLRGPLSLQMGLWFQSNREKCTSLVPNTRLGLMLRLRQLWLVGRLPLWGLVEMCFRRLPSQHRHRIWLEVLGASSREGRHHPASLPVESGQGFWHWWYQVR